MSSKYSNTGNREMKFWMWLVSLLPMKIIYYSVIRAGAIATTGKWSKTVVPELTLMDMIKRIDKKEEAGI